MRKLEALKIGGVQKKEKKGVLQVEKLLLLLVFFHYSFSFALQR
jgi:hypothetical protein